MCNGKYFMAVLSHIFVLLLSWNTLDLNASYITQRCFWISLQQLVGCWFFLVVFYLFGWFCLVLFCCVLGFFVSVFLMWATALLGYAESILFFSFMSCPPPLCYTVVNYSLVIMEFAWDVDTCFTVFYKAENINRREVILVIRILEGRSKFLNH